MLLLGLTAGVLICAVMLHRDQIRTLEPQSQAEWLADAAAQVAADRLKADSTWKGDTWTAPSEQTGLSESARIAISVSSEADRPAAQVATITVEFPPDSPQRVRVVQSIEIEMPASPQ